MGEIGSLLMREVAAKSTAIVMLAISSHGWAQEGGARCDGCESYAPRYHARPIALLAKRIGDEIPDLSRLWYLRSLGSAFEVRADGLGVLSWNSKGEVVGTRLRYDGLQPTPVPRAFAWLPAANYAGLASGLHDLLQRAYPGDWVTPSYAWDISDEGLVVGGAGAIAAKAGGSARAWDLTMWNALPPASYEVDFGVGSGSWTMSLAVTPRSAIGQTPRMYGVGSGPGVSEGACSDWRDPYEFFRWPPIAQVLNHNQPPDVGFVNCWTMSTRHWVVDVPQHGFGPVGSYEGPWFPDPQDPCMDGSDGLCLNACYTPMVVGSTAIGPSSALEIFYRIEGSSSSTPSAGQRTGIRSSTARAGAAGSRPPILAGYYFDAESATCTLHAGLWTYGITAPIRNRLPSSGGSPLLENLSPLAQRWRAAGCGSTGEVVLGWNSIEGDPMGLIWTLPCSGGPDFQLHAARELLAAPSPVSEPASNRITVEQMYDILPTGEILAIVRQYRPPGSAQGSADFNLYAAVLGLYGDLDGDHVVGSADLAVLLGDWGTAPNGSSGDLNWDLQVDAQDLTSMRGLFDPTPKRLLLPADADNTSAYCMMLPGEVCAGEPVGFGARADALDCCMACALGACGFETTESFAAWSRVAEPVALECTCLILHAMIHNQIETEH